MSSPPFNSPDYPLPLRLAARAGGRLRLALLVVIATAAITLWWTGILGELVEPDRIRALVAAAGPAAPVAFILLLIPLNPVFLAGAPIWISSTVFPLHLAVIYSIVGAVITSAATHSLARYFGQEWATTKIPTKLHGFRNRLEKRPLRAIATLRVLLWINPGVDLLMAVSKVRMRDYLLGTALGLALPTALRVYLVHAGIEAAGSGSSNVWMWALIPLAALALLGVTYYRKTKPQQA